MRRLLVVGIVVGIAACADVSTAPSSQKAAPDNPALRDMTTCRSGYVIAYRSDGTAYCADTTSSGGTMTATATTTTTSK